MGHLLIISGVPASGKSSYGTWLADRGWTFVDHDWVFNGRRRAPLQPMEQTWRNLVMSQPPRVADFVEVVARAQEDVVLEYGFPYAWFPAVRQLKAAGAQHWWFEADHQTARAAFIIRNEERSRLGQHDLIVPIGAFEIYVGEIAAHRDEIKTVFDPKIIETLKVGGQRIPLEEVDRTIVASSMWPASATAHLKLGRNDPCWCGSGKKFKRCHGR